MGKFFNFVEEDNIVDNKKEPTYTSDLESNTLLINEESTIPRDKKNKINAPKRKRREHRKIKLPKFNKWYLLIVPILIIILIICMLVMYLLNLRDFDVLKTNAFFIENHDHKYALFNENGKKLTDFSFVKVSSFINNAALVENEFGQYGVINNKGHMVVDYDKYPYIFNEGPLYFLTDYESDYYLITAKGKKIYNEIGFEILSYSDSYVFLKHDNKYKLLNYNGKVIYSFKDKNLEEIPSISKMDDYITIYYDHKIDIINVKKSKKVLSFQSRERFCITDTTKNGLIIVGCDAVGDILVPYSYRIIINNKIKSDIVLNEDAKPEFNGNVVIYNKDNTKYIMDHNGKKVTDIINTAYYDYDKYAKVNNDRLIDIYYNGKLVKTIGCSGLQEGLVDAKTYLFKECGTNNEYRYYNLKGKKVSSSYEEATPFINNVAIIKENNNYYLINKKFKKVSKGYDKIIYSNVADYYIASNENKKIILNHKGKELVSGYDIKIFNEETNFGYMALINEINSYVVYNLSKDKRITSLINEPQFSKHYFTVDKGTEKYYYSYKNGISFYTY